MPLSSGHRLGVYEISVLIGEGGMGQVYQARDTKLDRDVAIKVLPEVFVADPERIARFEREAKTLASLNHPHIGGIYGLEDADGVRALILELVPGPTLSDRIAQGALPIDEALAVAKQIAEALEAAHEQGIIHRDLKPANVKVRPDGTVKVLDFGLAKAVEPAVMSSRMSMSPTLSLQGTFAGVILGTAAYMSPEQARGRTVDRRTDVWAFGCVLFEMLSGRRPFDGEDLAETIGAVIHKDPAWDRLPVSTPATVRTALQRCLQKDPKERIRDIGDVQLALKGAFDAPARLDAAPAQAVAAPLSLWRRALPIAATAIVVGALAGAVAWMSRAPLPAKPVIRFSIALGEGQSFTANNTGSVALSPDGTRLAYVANLQLYLRAMDDLEAKPIPGTSQNPSPIGPVFSPDGQSIAFVSQADRVIKTIAISGGAAVTVCPIDLPILGMSWDTSGILVGQTKKGIVRVSGNGGQPDTLVSARDRELLHGPQMLPGGEWLLFTSATVATSEGWDKAQIVAQSLKTSERKTLVPGGSDGRYVPSGHIVYALGGILFAVPFDLGHVSVAGGPVSVIEGIKRSGAGTTGISHLAMANTGTIAFVPGPPSNSSVQTDLALIDRNGIVQPLKLPVDAYEFPRVSPSGKQIAFDTDNGKEANIWIYDLSGVSGRRQLTLGGHNHLPVWSADGERVAFQSDREGDLGLWWQRVDGATPAERLTKPDKDTTHLPQSWSTDGKTLLFNATRGGTHSLMVLTVEDKKIAPFGSGVESQSPMAAVFSPDGKWVAYSMTVDAGQPAGSLFVQPFPTTGATYPVAKNGIHPTWSPDGKELHYGPAAGSGATVTVTTRPGFSFGSPVVSPRVFIERGPTVERGHDIMPDGRFLAVVAGQQTTGAGTPVAPQIQVVLNWFEYLKQRVPTH